MYKHEIEYCKKVIASGAKGEALKSAQMRLKEAEAGMKKAKAKSTTAKNVIKEK
jgi:hypothetical protein